MIGVLIVNLGTPSAPTPKALRRYLKQFLSDPRVVEFPRLPWWILLNLVILNLRSRSSARSYQKIWTPQGSPLMVTSQKQVEKLQAALDVDFKSKYLVKLAMSYGRPTIQGALNEMDEPELDQIVVLPLYPQYSGSTTGSVFTDVVNALKKWRRIPTLHTIHRYHIHPDYIAAVKNKISEHWQEHRRGEKLIFSFHGIPQRYVDAGDPYYDECKQSSQLIAKALGLSSNQWMTCFQSRFGPSKWIEPATDKELIELSRSGIKRVDVVCPGFSCDCLETLLEIDEENRALFVDAGGEQFKYIPCLNDDAEHISLLAKLVRENSYT